MFLIAISATSFGAMAIFTRQVYASGAGVIAVLCVRFVLAAALMLLVTFATRRRWPRGRKLLMLLLMGALGYVGQSFAYFSALNHASASLVALLLYLYPCLVTILGAVLLGQHLTRPRVLALGAALLGTALTLGDALSGSLTGVFYGLSAAVIYAVYIVVGSRATAGEDAFAATTVIMSAAAGVFTALSFVVRPEFPKGTLAWLSMLFIALVSTVLAMVAFFAGMRRLGPADAATLSTLEPVVTLLLASIFLNEQLQPLQLLGGALILTAVVILTRLPAAATISSRLMKSS